MHRVLIVNDSRTMCMTLHCMLDQYPGFSVVGMATSADDAMALLNDTRPTIVLIDLCMPYIDGSRLLTMMAEYTALTKVVLSGSYSKSSELEQRLFALGASAFIDKQTVAANPGAFREKLLKLAKRRGVSRVATSVPAVGTNNTNVIFAAARFPVPSNEAARLTKLAALKIANLKVDPYLDIIVRHLTQATGYQIAAVNLMTATSAVTKAAVGIAPGLYPRAETLCAHALCEEGPMVIADAAAHPVFSTFAMVTGAPHVRAYAGVPIAAKDGTRLGVLCIADDRPGRLSIVALNALTNAAHLVAEFLEMPAATKRRVA